MIDTDSPVPARLLAKAIDRLCLAFEHSAGPRSHIHPDARFVIQDVRIGSLILDLLAVADAAFTLRDLRDLLASFVAQMSDALKVMTGFRQYEARPSFQGSIETLAQLITLGRARQVSINIVGDNNTLIITPSIIEEMEAARKKKSKASRLPRSSSVLNILSRSLRSNEMGEESCFIGRVVEEDGMPCIAPDGSNGKSIPLAGSPHTMHRINVGDAYTFRGRQIKDADSFECFFVLSAQPAA